MHWKMDDLQLRIESQRVRGPALRQRSHCPGGDSDECLRAIRYSCLEGARLFFDDTALTLTLTLTLRHRPFFSLRQGAGGTTLKRKNTAKRSSTVFRVRAEMTTHWLVCFLGVFEARSSVFCIRPVCCIGPTMGPKQ